ncbi:MAG: mercuric reductase [Planctomycetota bacterium]|nr:mercuric reductase [Planctomycetota bacterium]
MHPALLPDDEHNRRLLANVHPADWVNPEPASRYNLVVLGAGTAGLISAIGAAGLGGRVALVERGLMGGDCLNVGCVPSKAMLRAARAAAEVRRANELGVLVSADTGVDFPKVMERLRKLRADISPNDSAMRYRERGVDVFQGEGRFTGPRTLEVGGATLRFQRAVIATGARALRPNLPGLNETGFLTNETVFSLTELPRRLAILGGGPIGCELAQAFARFGSHVILIDKHDRLLQHDDVDAAAVVRDSLARDGVELRLNATVSSVVRSSEGKGLTLQVAGQVEQITVDEILVGAGRVPNVEGIGLEQAGVAFDARKGIVVNDRLQTTNSRIFAAGDVCSRFQFTHAADAMARIVIQNALFFGRAKASALNIPWCTYTDPELAQVGLSEESAREQGIAIDTFRQEMRHVDRAILDDATEGFVKVHVRRGTDRIVGATIVAAHAGEMISEVTLAMTNGLGLKALGRTIHPYPTQAEALKRIADAYSRTRLTPFVQSLFRRWLAWTR